MRTTLPPQFRTRRIAGFTLIEVVIVIAILGVVSAICAVFMKTAFDSYFTSVRHAEMVEAADVAVQRLARELRLAVPNSVRIIDSSGNTGTCAANTTCYLEFVPTKSGGIYRNDGDGSTSGNFMCDGTTAGQTNPTFDLLGKLAPGTAVSTIYTSYVKGDFVVVDNEANLPAAGAVYGGGSRAVITSTSNSTPMTISSATGFGNGSIICGSYTNNRFQIVDQTVQAVTYACPARSGIEWGVYQVWSSYSPPSRANSTCPTVNPTSFTPTAPTLNAFIVTVTCFKTTDPSSAGGPTVFTINSVACNMPTAGACAPGGSNGIGGLNYVERSVTVSM
jgi:MSHA biogenesis protein MshO